MDRRARAHVREGFDGRCGGASNICGQKAYSAGSVDGFDLNNGGSREPFFRYTEQQIPNYWQYARNFVLADHVFSTTLGPSTPGHTVFWTGRSLSIENAKCVLPDGGDGSVMRATPSRRSSKPRRRRAPDGRRSWRSRLDPAHALRGLRGKALRRRRSLRGVCEGGARDDARCVRARGRATLVVPGHAPRSATLARALPSADRKRARALATSARAAIARDGHEPKLLAAADAWLATAP